MIRISLLVVVLSGFFLSACSDEPDNPNIRQIKKNSESSPYDIELPDAGSDELKPETDEIKEPTAGKAPVPASSVAPAPQPSASSPPPQSGGGPLAEVPAPPPPSPEPKVEEVSISSIAGVYSGQITVEKRWWFGQDQRHSVNVLINYSSDLQNLIIAVVYDGNERLCTRFINLPAWTMDSDGSGRLSFTSPVVKGKNIGAIGNLVGAAGVLSAQPIKDSGFYLPQINLFDKRDRMSSIEGIQILDQPLPDFDSISVLCGFAS